VLKNATYMPKYSDKKINVFGTNLSRVRNFRPGNFCRLWRFLPGYIASTMNRDGKPMGRRYWKLSAFLIAVTMTACSQNTPPTPGGPGWTGQTVVIGNNSTIAGNAEATYQQQRWPLQRR
jgi:hypothetical protein